MYVAGLVVSELNIILLKDITYAKIMFEKIANRIDFIFYSAPSSRDVYVRRVRRVRVTPFSYTSLH